MFVLSQMSEQTLRDLAQALQIAVQQINIMSATASRFIRLEQKISAELQCRNEELQSRKTK